MPISSVHPEYSEKIRRVAGNLSHALPLIHVYFKIADAGVSSHTPDFERAAGGRQQRSQYGQDGRLVALGGRAVRQVVHRVPSVSGRWRLRGKREQLFKE